MQQLYSRTFTVQNQFQVKINRRFSHNPVHQDISCHILLINFNQIEELADNFAIHYRDTQSSRLQASGLPSYSLVFTPPAEALARAIESNTIPNSPQEKIRPLTELEQKGFMKAFTSANEKASTKKK